MSQKSLHEYLQCEYLHSAFLISNPRRKTGSHDTSFHHYACSDQRTTEDGDFLSVRAGNTKFSAGILFDEGSQQSYTTQELAESLQLPVDGTEILDIYSFGGNTTQEQANKGTIFVWTEANEKIPLHVVIAPTIAKSIDISMTSLADT